MDDSKIKIGIRFKPEAELSQIERILESYEHKQVFKDEPFYVLDVLSGTENTALEMLREKYESIINQIASIYFHCPDFIDE